MYVTYYKNIKRNTNTPKSLEDFLNLSTNPIEQKKKITFATTPEKMPLNQDFLMRYKTILYTIALHMRPYANADLKTLYTTFKIPKASGGYRTINAPIEHFKNTLKTITHYLKQLNILEHDAAYAYVTERNPLNAMQQHQNNQSKYFLKIDFKDFFGTCKKDFVYQQLTQLFPITHLINSEECATIVNNLTEIACLNGALPQGSPLSPYLTNLIMVPIDYAIVNSLPNTFIYTRYADDMLISCKEPFDPEWVLKRINHIISNTPLKINKDKTRYGSNAGRNWNLGLMYNKECNITIGYKQKQTFKAILHSLIKGTPEQTPAQIKGLISYYRSIEPDYINYIIHKYETKYNTNIKALLNN